MKDRIPPAIIAATMAALGGMLALFVDRLVNVSDTQLSIVARYTYQSEQQGRTLEDHEIRIRTLEGICEKAK